MICKIFFFLKNFCAYKNYFNYSENEKLNFFLILFMFFIFSKYLKNHYKIFFKKYICFDLFSTTIEVNIFNIRKILINFFLKFIRLFLELKWKKNAPISDTRKIDKSTFNFFWLEKNCPLTKKQVKMTKFYLFTIFGNNNPLTLNYYLNQFI